MTDPPRPRRRRKEARPGEIVEAAFQLFDERGYGAARMVDLAARAGVAKGTLYRYFPTKAELFRAVVRSRLGPPLDGIAAELDAFPGPTRDLLALILRRIHAEVARGEVPRLARIILSEHRAHPELAALYHAQALAPGRALLGRVLARGVARGEVRDGAAARMPLLLVAPALMAAIWRMTFEEIEPLDLEAVFEAHLDLALHGVLVRDA